MSLEEEIRKLVRSNLDALQEKYLSDNETLENSFKIIAELVPILNEIAKSANDGFIKTEIKYNWEGYTAAAFIRLGDLKFYGECTHSGDMLPIGDGSYWYFFPCYSEKGEESWSFNDQRWGHKWFDSAEDMFSHLIPRIAEEIAKYEHKNT